MYIDDDRDDQYDPEFRQPWDYCEHGQYIGHPYGADILCQWCEDGISRAEYLEIMAERKDRSKRASTRRRLQLRMIAGELGHTLSDFYSNETIKNL